MKTNLAFNILNFITNIVGETALVITLVLSLICTLKALLLLSEEYRVVFVRSMHACGIIIAIYGILLPFRETVHPIATILSLWWGVLFNDLLAYFKIIQFLVLDITSWIFWFYYYSTPDGQESFFMLKIGDWLIFVLAPTLFGLVMLSKHSASLFDGGYKSYGSRHKEYTLPLNAILTKLSTLLEKIIPPN